MADCVAAALLRATVSSNGLLPASLHLLRELHDGQFMRRLKLLDSLVLADALSEGPLAMLHEARVQVFGSLTDVSDFSGARVDQGIDEEHLTMAGRRRS